MTVSCRRSAVSTDGTATSMVGPLGLPPALDRAAIAFRSRLRFPSGTLSFSRSASVRSGRTSAPISFSRKTSPYWPNPRPRSQSPTSIAVPLAWHTRPRTLGQLTPHLPIAHSLIPPMLATFTCRWRSCKRHQSLCFGRCSDGHSWWRTHSLARGSSQHTRNVDPAVDCASISHRREFFSRCRPSRQTP